MTIRQGKIHNALKAPAILDEGGLTDQSGAIQSRRYRVLQHSTRHGDVASFHANSKWAAACA